MSTCLWLLLAGCFLVPGSKDGDGDPADVTVGDDDDAVPPTPGETDEDGDGFTADVDCNDRDESIHPDADERCDPGDIDEDCDGKSDSADDDAIGAITAYHDADGDGFG